MKKIWRSMTSPVQKTIIILLVASFATPIGMWIHAIHMEAEVLRADPAFRVVASCSEPKKEIFNDYVIDDENYRMIPCN